MGHDIPMGGPVVGHGSRTGEDPHSCPLWLALSQVERPPAHLWLRQMVKS